MTTEEKGKKIIEDIKKEEGTDPALIFRHLAEKSYVGMHGPEHHVLDGAAILVAYRNAGGRIDLDRALEQMLREGLRMPGAMCGLWGVCGAVSSIGAALAAIDGTGPLSADGSWGDHMAYTSAALMDLGKVNGPRCCKRDAMLAFRNAVSYIEKTHGVHLDYEDAPCGFSARNPQCIGERCPFYPGGERKERKES